MRSESILLVAIQCPYSGGAAVMSARAYLHLLNDTLEYDDEAICSAMGIYRIQNLQSGKNEKELMVIPNPSNGIVQLVYTGLSGNEITVEVYDVLGKLVFTKSILSSSNTIQLTLTNFNNGLYNLKLSDQYGKHLTEKILLYK